MERLEIKESFAEQKVNLKRTHTSARVVWHFKNLQALSVFISVFRDVGSIASTSPVLGGSNPPLIPCVQLSFRNVQGCQHTWRTQ